MDKDIDIKQSLIMERKLTKIFAYFCMSFLGLFFISLIISICEKIKDGYGFLGYDPFEIIGFVGGFLFIYFVPFRFGRWLNKVLDNQIEEINKGEYVYFIATDIKEYHERKNNKIYFRCQITLENGENTIAPEETVREQQIDIGSAVRVLKWLENGKYTYVFAHY